MRSKYFSFFFRHQNQLIYFNISISTYYLNIHNVYVFFFNYSYEHTTRRTKIKCINGIRQVTLNLDESPEFDIYSPPPRQRRAPEVHEAIRRAQEEAHEAAREAARIQAEQRMADRRAREEARENEKQMR